MADWFASLFGLGGNLLGSALNYQYTKGLQNHQYKLNIKGLKESPLASRTGLEKAGYNPILGLGNTTNASVSPATAPGTSDLGTDSVNAYQNSQRIKNENKSTEATVQNLVSQSNQSNAQAELSKEQAITEQAKRTQMEFQNAMLDVEKHLKEKELSWADRKFYSEIYDNMQRAENYGAMASIARYNAETERRNAQTNAMNAQTSRGNLEIAKEIQAGNAEQQKKIEEFYRRHPHYAGILTGVGETGKALGTVFGGHYGINYSMSQPTTTETVKFNKNAEYQGHKRTTRKKSKR